MTTNFQKLQSTSSMGEFPSSSSPFEEIDDLITISPEMPSVIEYERELMKRRSNLLRSLKDPVIYQEFMRFMSNSKSTRFLFVLNLIFMIFFGPTFAKLIAPFSPSARIWFAFELIFEIVMTITGWLLYGCMEQDSFLRSYSQWIKQKFKINTWDELGDSLQAIFFISAIIVRALDLIQRSTAGDCLEDTEYMSTFSCNTNGKSNTFPTDSLLVLMIMPIFFGCVLRETRIRVLSCAWFIVVFTLLYTSILFASSQSIAILVFYVLSSGLIILDSFKQCLLFYLLSRQLRRVIEANQKLSVQNKATEMRHLIANVAHDLKTPLSSFMTGIDIISADIIDCMKKLETTSSSSTVTTITAEYIGGTANVTKEYLTSMMSGLQSCIMNIRNTNAFMLMTINRCLDYTKASNGLKLVPKNETIDLQETINMPLQCMTNIQNKMKITLQSFETQNICSHIITDRQWLQENLLCLLSNAVKYSGEGEVLIKVTRVTRAVDRNVNKANSNDDSDDYHPASPTKRCYRIEDEVITSEPEHYQSPLTAKRKTSQVNKSGKLDKRNKIAPVDHFLPAPPKRDSQSTITVNQVMNAPDSLLDYDSDLEKGEEERFQTPERYKPVREKSNTSNTSSNSNASNISNLSHLIPDTTSEKSFSEELMFEVIDPGIGIAGEAMKSLFNPFKQTQRLAGGTGLGLYSLAKRIEALNGKYGVHARVDKKQGSVFWFTIPYREDTVTAAESNEVSLMTTQLEGGNEREGLIETKSFSTTYSSSPRAISMLCRPSSAPTLSVLIVEDTPSIAKMTSMMLKRQKHRTEVAENGQIALKILYQDEATTAISQSQRYDVVLMDLQMPVMDGLEATRRIRALEKEKVKEREMADREQIYHQIVIGVSANSDHETMEEAFNAGIDEFLPKPFSIEAFLTAVQRSQMKYHTS